MSKRLSLLISFLVVLGLVGGAAAEDKTWTGAVDTDWFNAANWDPAGVPEGDEDGAWPGDGDRVIINGTGVTNFPVISTTGAECGQLWLGSAADSGDAYLTIEGVGELTVRNYETGSGNQTIVLGQKTGTHGFLNMTGGTINMAPAGETGDEEQMEVGGRSSQGRGTFNMTGGKLNNGGIRLPGFGGWGVSEVNLGKRNPDGSLVGDGVIDCNSFEWAADSNSGTLNLYSGTIYCGNLGFYSGGYCNLYGGEIHSFTWKMWGSYGVVDIYDGIWYNYTQGNPDPNADQRRMTYDVRYYVGMTPPQIVAYGDRGAVVVEWTNMNHPDPNLRIAEGDLWELMNYNDPNRDDPNALHYDPNVFWWVRADFNPDIAFWPEPEDTFGGADPNHTLHWSPAYSGNAALHDVYFGNDFDDVNIAEVGDPCYIGRQEANSITRPECWPVVFELGKTYYWRIDEINDLTPPYLWRGDVWSFSISYVCIEDFESYNSDAELRAVWKDKSDPENSTGCQVWSVPVGEWHALDAKSMKMKYVNYFNPFYSEVWYDFAEDQDWSPAATKARLVALSYFGATHATTGESTNPPDYLYVKLKDSLGAEATQRLSDASAVQVTQWTERLFALREFVGVDLSKISRITIGVGQDPPVKSGIGIIWVDNVRLYLPRCDTSYLWAPGDINGNCVTDLNDLDPMVGEGTWLMSNYDVEVTAPADDPVLWYKFDGNSVDSSGNSYDGTVVDPCDPNYMPGHDPNSDPNGQALVFNGSASEPTHVDVPLGFLSTIDKEITVSVWLNNAHSGTRTVFAGEPNDLEFGDRILYLMFTGDTANLVIGNETYADPNNGRTDSMSRSPVTDEFVDEWTHWAFTKDCDANKMAIYVNGELLANEEYHNSGDYNVAIAGIYSFILGCNQRHDGGYAGLMDDFRVYDYALTQGEVCSLAGEDVGSTFTQPLQRLLNTGYDVDLTDDGTVDFKDFAILAQTWLQTWMFGDYPDNIYP